jgi:hypothetical protein
MDKKKPQSPKRNKHTDQIDKKTLEISQADDETYSDMATLAEELPDHSPRFILLSYPLTMASLHNRNNKNEARHC